ncbi:lipoprotein [Streptomyces minutiscleroticus]|uniref:Lipoprotein n=1 Tax=Streptomyces minutiscleroticus TaxID=68238 RepID=A0A918U7A8_9ACTN|nr:META domain-containing protein [Streptomyces minutiscleroticus]GGY03717.1 lipoprotein [Streptomyces minutiscleroticus]
MYRQRLTLIALIVLPLAAACGSEPADSGPAGTRPRLTGVQWKVDSVTVDGTTHRAPAGATVRFGEDGGVRGNYGCNTFSAKAAVEGDRVDLGQAKATRMACEKEPMGFERVLSRTLAAGPLRADARNDGELTLTTDGGDKVDLSAEESAPLLGTTWVVESLGSGKGARSLPREAAGKAYLTFDGKDGTVAGSLGCNRVSAKATVGDGTITLGTPTTTRKMCSESLMETEKALLELFDGTVSYEVDHRTLTLTSENGKSFSAVAKE